MEILLIPLALFLLAAPFIALWHSLRAAARVQELEERIQRLEAENWARAVHSAAAPVEQPVPPVPPPAAAIRPEPLPPPPPTLVDRPVTSGPPPEPEPPTPVPGWTDRIRAAIGDESWESLVGISFLNKIGAVVTVIGIILFLGYSFTQMGPVGRVTVSLAVSLGLLAGGFFLERRDAYRVIAWGLLGAGWASLYATVFSMYALPAAKVIESETAGTALLLLVAAAMVAHANHYHSEALVGVASAAAFGALAIAPSNQFAVGGLLPLSAAVLFLARRNGWFAAALGCEVATYAILIARGDPNSTLAASQSFVFFCWLLFNAFDLLSIRAKSRPRHATLLYPVNTSLALGLSYAKWQSVAPNRLWIFLAAAAACYLADALLRLWLLRDEDLGDAPIQDRLRRGSFEPSIVLASALAALAIIRRAGGAWQPALLGVEAQLLILSGWRWRIRFLEWIGAAVYSYAVAACFFIPGRAQSPANLGPLHFHSFTPAALFLAAIGYLNRRWRAIPFPCEWGGWLLVLLVIGREAPDAWIYTLWLAFAVVLLFFRLDHQAYAAAAISALAVSSSIQFNWYKFAPWRIWLPVAADAALLSVFSYRSNWRPARFAAACAAVLFTLCCTWTLLPDVLVATAWMALALLLIEFGGFEIRYIGHAVAALTFLRLFLANFTNAGGTAFLSHRLLTVGPAIAAFAVLWRRFRNTPGIESKIALGYSWAAAIATVVLLRFELGRVTVAAGWAVLALILLFLSVRFQLIELRRQSFAIAALAFIRAASTNFLDPASYGGLRQRLIVAALVVGSLYAAQLLLPRAEQRARAFFSLLATVLLSLLICHEVSGSLLTVALGLQGVLLLAAGFPLRDRVLRLAGMALLFTCILKLFLYDLRNLATLPRIGSFIVLGLILLGVSWVYARFKDRIRQVL